MSWVFILRCIPKRTSIHICHSTWILLVKTLQSEEVGSNFASCVANKQHGNSVPGVGLRTNSCWSFASSVVQAVPQLSTQVPRRKKALLPFRLLPFWFYRRPCCHLVRVKLSAEGAKRGVETIPNDIHSPMAKGHPGPSMSKGLDESFNNDDSW